MVMTMSSPAGLVHATLDKLTAWLGASPHQQDVVYSEASARKALSRRDFLHTAGAVAAGVVLADRVVEAVRAKDRRLLAHDSGAAEGYEIRMVAYSQFVHRHPAHIMASMPVHAMPRHAFEVWELASPDDCCEFEPGSVWNYSTGEGPGGQVLVTGIDRLRGIITVNSEPA